MALQPSTHAHPHAHASTAHGAHATHAAQHGASKAKASLSADEPGEGGGFAAQLLKAQPAAARDAKPAEAAKPKAEAKKPAREHASRDDGDAANAGDKDKDAKTADARTPAAIDPNALMPWAQAIAPPTTSLADKPAVAADAAGDPLGALRKAAGKGAGKEALIASLGVAARDGAKDAKPVDPLAAMGTGAPSKGDITAALAKAEDAVKAATDARDSLAALLPQPDPLTVQAGAIGAPPSALQDPNQGVQQAAPTVPTHATLPMPPHSPAFAPALGHQIDVWMKNGVQHAEVQLSPQDLGPIRVRIEMDGAQTRVHMTADVASTRDALQQAMPQLSDQLGLAGLSLSGGSVSDQPSFQSQSQAQAQANADGGFGGGRSSGATRDVGGVDDVAGGAAIASAARQQAQRRGLLDMYA